MLPQITMEQLAIRFNRCSLHEEAEHVANLASDLGEEAVQYLRCAVREGPIREAAEMVGLLSRLDPQCLMVFLPDGDLPSEGAEFLRVKAIEALGRIQEPETVSTLQRFVETKKLFTWAYPQELRIAAMQALEKLDRQW